MARGTFLRCVRNQGLLQKLWIPDEVVTLWLWHRVIAFFVELMNQGYIRFHSKGNILEITWMEFDSMERRKKMIVFVTHIVEKNRQDQMLMVKFPPFFSMMQNEFWKDETHMRGCEKYGDMVPFMKSAWRYYTDFIKWETILPKITQ